MRTLDRSPGQCRLLTWHLLSLKSGAVPCCVTYIRGTFRATHSIRGKGWGGGGGGFILPIYHHIMGTKARVSWYPLLVLTRVRSPSCEMPKSSSCARRVSRLPHLKYSVTCPRTILNTLMAGHRGYGPQKTVFSPCPASTGERSSTSPGDDQFRGGDVACQAGYRMVHDELCGCHVQGGDWTSALGVQTARPSRCQPLHDRNAVL